VSGAVGWLHAKASVRPTVVVAYVVIENALGVVLVPDDDVVEAVPAAAASSRVDVISSMVARRHAAMAVGRRRGWNRRRESAAFRRRVAWATDTSKSRDSAAFAPPIRRARRDRRVAFPHRRFHVERVRWHPTQKFRWLPAGTSVRRRQIRLCDVEEAADRFE